MNIKNKNFITAELRYLQTVLVTTTLLCCMGIAHADIGTMISRPTLKTSAGSTTVNVSGSITAKPCNLNSGKDLDYAFGDVVVNDVVGEKHTITHPLKIVCYSTKEQAQVMFKGTTATSGTNAGANVLQVGNTGLGISMFNGASPLKLNDYIDVSNDETIQLKAVLTHLDPGKLLHAGDFSSSLTIETRYN